MKDNLTMTAYLYLGLTVAFTCIGVGMMITWWRRNDSISKPMRQNERPIQEDWFYGPLYENLLAHAEEEAEKLRA